MLIGGLAACTLPPLESPTPRPTSTPTSALSPNVTEPIASASSGPSADPTPDFATVPDFAAGDIIATTIDGLRVRARPGVDRVVVAGLLPVDAELQVIMGPVPVDDLGWYLVADADEAEPQFEEGWIAAGFEPEAFVVSTGRAPESSPFVASFSGLGEAEYGPIEINEGNHAIRWLALDPEAVRCQFEVTLAQGDGEPVPAIRATVGNDLVPGTLQPSSFAALGVSGQAFVAARTDCAWTFVIMRVADDEIAPTPGPTP